MNAKAEDETKMSDCRGADDQQAMATVREMASFFGLYGEWYKEEKARDRQT
jgi:hypothetical protein